MVTSGEVEFAVCRKWGGGVNQPPRQFMPCLLHTVTHNQRVLSPGTSARPGDLPCQTCLQCLLTMSCLVLWKFSVLNCSMSMESLWEGAPLRHPTCGGGLGGSKKKLFFLLGHLLELFLL